MKAPAKAFGPLLLLTTGALLAACSRQESLREIDWAKSALARNPAYEIVATDESSGIFTVRDTETGEVLTLHLKDLIAAADEKNALVLTTAKDHVRLPPALQKRVSVFSVRLEWDDKAALLSLLQAALDRR